MQAAQSGNLARLRSTEVTAPASGTAPEPKPLTAGQQRRRVGRSARFLALTVAVVAILAAAIALWSFVLRDRFIAKRFGVVIPGQVFRSGQISKSLIADVVERHKIGTIIDLNGLDPNDADQRAEMDVAEAKGIRHLRFPLKGDATGPIERYAGAVEAMVQSDHEGRPVLVHCAAGTQRTGACISFYRLLVRHDPPEDVYRELLRYGWDPNANHILADYVNGHMRELAGLLVERHAIDRAPDPPPVLHP
jgi:predicted protein tyrosine phosphatase